MCVYVFVSRCSLSDIYDKACFKYTLGVSNICTFLEDGRRAAMEKFKGTSEEKGKEVSRTPQMETCQVRGTLSD